jgi:phosphopantothenate synthetase
MATLLNKSVTREVPVEDGNGRKLIVTINAEDLTIDFKPKGRTSKAIVSLPIQKVYQLVKNAN